MSRLDWLRSLVRGAGDRARLTLSELSGVGSFRERLGELRERKIALPEARLTAILARTPGVRQLSASVQEDGVHLDVALEGGEALRLMLCPEEPRFAPRGAKELSLLVHPSEALREPIVAELASSLAGAIALALWGPVVHGDLGAHGAVPTRAADRLRFDLRDVPPVRAAIQRGGPLALLIDVLEPERIELRPGALVVCVRLPSLRP